MIHGERYEIRRHDSQGHLFFNWSAHNGLGLVTHGDEMSERAAIKYARKALRQMRRVQSDPAVTGVTKEAPSRPLGPDRLAEPTQHQETP